MKKVLSSLFLAYMLCYELSNQQRKEKQAESKQYVKYVLNQMQQIHAHTYTHKDTSEIYTTNALISKKYKERFFTHWCLCFACSSWYPDICNG